MKSEDVVFEVVGRSKTDKNEVAKAREASEAK
jgi:hypothetical protein